MGEEGTWVALQASNDEGTRVFVTVARGDDEEFDDRVADISVDQLRNLLGRGCLRGGARDASEAKLGQLRALLAEAAEALDWHGRDYHANSRELLERLRAELREES